MDLTKRHLFSSFLICFFGFLLVQALFPTARISPFTPFLIIAIYNCPIKKGMCIACLTGATLDLTCGEQLGPYMLTTLFATITLYPLRRYLFADHTTTLPLMSAFFCSLQYVLLFHYYPIHWSDVISVSISTVLFSLFLFTLPSLFFGKRIKKGKEYFAA